MKQYEKALDILQKKFEENISALADQIREDVIIPVCKKHKLIFISGMGSFFFARGDKTYTDTHDRMSDSLREDLVPILNLLNTEVTHNQYLGFYVDDVRKGKGK